MPMRQGISARSWFPDLRFSGEKYFKTVCFDSFILNQVLKQSLERLFENLSRPESFQG
jgi:hypothetical protein